MCIIFDRLNFMNKNISKNKRINLNYVILSKYTAGLALQGWEARSIRVNNPDLSSSFIKIKNNELYANFRIDPAKTIARISVSLKERDKKLLLHKREINRLSGILSANPRYTLVPDNLYWKGNLAKITVCLVKPRKFKDTKKYIKERDLKKSINKNLKQFQWKEKI